ncbi:DASH complex subunit ask1 [Apophysomyces ossiformis]|uniref:DASH complex subunit ASK1 n=1 Tax=Apophysomyces ossiformis TaxID=679940 RepID=A0A8H7ENW6_9FUNG|nr:DASH complex subunit ask1 [Apophysomyces ossiformis]
MSMTDEEADAELERLQQNITLSLQAIDQNFARCHQIVSERLLPIVDRLAEASQRVRNFNRMWLHYFAADGSSSTPVHNQLDIDDGTTNRPPFGDPISASSPSILSLRSHGRLRPTRPPFAASSSIAPTPRNVPYDPNDTSSTSSRLSPGISSVSVTEDDNSEATQRDHRGFALSPPRTLPFARTPAQLLRTPQREAARMLTEDLLWSAGGPSPSTQSSDSDRLPLEKKDSENMDRKESRKDKGKAKRTMSMEDAWTESNLDEDDEAGRAKFEKFARNRRLHLQQMGEHDELPSISPRHRSPMAQGPWVVDRILPSTPTMQRVLTTYNQDLRTLKRQRTEQDSDHHVSDRDIVSFKEKERLPSSQTPMAGGKEEVEQQRQGLQQQQQQRAVEEVQDMEEEEERRQARDDTTGLQSFEYDFAPLPEGGDTRDGEGDHASQPFSGTLLPQDPLRTPSEASHNLARMSPGMYSVASTSTMTMVRGITGQIPARFSLDYFAQAFRVPPGSTQLTAVYFLFADRPGQMLTKEDALALLPDYGHETISLLVGQYAGKGKKEIM